MRDAHNKVNTAKERRLHTVSSIKMLRVICNGDNLFITFKTALLVLVKLEITMVDITKKIVL